MPSLRIAHDERGVHHTQFTPGSPPYQQGQTQADVSMQHYHILVAALTKKYSCIDSPKNAHGGYINALNKPGEISIDASAFGPGSRQTIDLSSYKAYKLESITGVKLHPSADGTIHPEDLKVYHGNFQDNWKTQEGGILYCVGESREFWNCIISYHGPTQSTGIKEWDELFNKLKLTGYAKNIIPCMFFGREAGCMDKNCPFLHDRDVVLANRAQVLDKRRKTFDVKITPRQRHARDSMLVDEAGPDPKRRSAFMQSAKYKLARENEKNVKACCANPSCLKPWFESQENSPFQVCSKCKFTYYCSAQCQMADWKRHKKDPCATIEGLVNDDDLWNIIGSRKGTEYLNVDWGTA